MKKDKKKAENIVEENQEPEEKDTVQELDLLDADPVDSELDELSLEEICQL